MVCGRFTAAGNIRFINRQIRNETKWEIEKYVQYLFPSSCCHYKFHRRISSLLLIVNSNYILIMLCGLQPVTVAEAVNMLAYRLPKWIRVQSIKSCVRVRVVRTPTHKTRHITILIIYFIVFYFCCDKIRNGFLCLYFARFLDRHGERRLWRVGNMRTNNNK